LFSRHNRLVLLQRAEQGPQGRVLMADDAGEGVVPAFTHVVGPLRRVHCGPVLVPRHWRERRWRAVQLQQQATAWDVCFAPVGRRTPLSYVWSK